MPRAAIIVLDGLGIGPAPDSDQYGDTGSDALGNVARAVQRLSLPNLEELGLGCCAELPGLNDVSGFVAGLEELDAALPQLLAKVRQEDLVIFTADHGNDSTTPSTDHSRKVVPRSSFADIGQTVAEFFGVEPLKRWPLISWRASPWMIR